MEATNKLDPDFKKKWIDALRSGEYKQGKNTLYDQITNSFCCLGVACVVASGKLPVAGYFFIPERADMHPEFGHADAVPKILRGGTRVSVHLANMNDGGIEFDKSISFDEIADWIEENL